MMTDVVAAPHISSFGRSGTYIKFVAGPPWGRGGF